MSTHRIILTFTVWTLFFLPFRILASTKQAENSINKCILIFESPHHPFSKFLINEFSDKNDFKIISSAIPTDIKKCVTLGATEILIFAHTTYSSKNASTKLVYFKEYSETKFTETQNKIKNALIEATKKLREQIDQEKENGNCPTTNPRNLAYSKCSKLNNQIITLKSRLNAIEKREYQKNRYFEPMVFLDKSFEDVANNLNHLRSIRFLSCDPESLFKTYPSLEIIKSSGINLDFAPAQKIMSLIKGKNVRVLDKAWVQISNHSNDYVPFYIKIKNLGVLRFGQAKSSDGRFSITVRGPAFGLASYWTKMNVPKHITSGLKVGEKKSYTHSDLSLSAAFWLNADLNLLQTPRIQGTTEINSLGLSLGLPLKAEIQRLY